MSEEPKGELVVAAPLVVATLVNHQHQKGSVDPVVVIKGGAATTVVEVVHLLTNTQSCWTMSLKTNDCFVYSSFVTGSTPCIFSHHARVERAEQVSTPNEHGPCTSSTRSYLAL